MIRLVKHTSKMTIPHADYVLEKSEKLLDILNVLTPKFSGKWDIILIDPKTTFV